MCFGLGLGCLLALIEILPYICLVTVPLLGSFYGADTIHRISFLLIVHSFLVECIPRTLYQVLPFFNLLLFIILMYLPVSVTPWPAVWLYDKIIWLTEPVLMIAEIVLLQNFVMRQSQSSADEIEKDEGSSYKYKGAILIFASICYAMTASLGYNIYSNAAYSQVLCLFVVACLLIAVHNMMLMAHEGIVSDSAFCSLASITVLYIMVMETEQINSPLSEPHLWKNNSSAASNYLNILISILQQNTAAARRSIAFMMRFVSPLFLCLLAIRLYSILFIVNKITRNYFEDKGDEDFSTTLQNFDERDFSPWKSPFLLKASIIFMLSQVSSHALEEWSGHAASVPWLADSTKYVWPSQLLFGRLLQVVAINCFYMWRLYRADDWTWNPWLTP